MSDTSPSPTPRIISPDTLRDNRIPPRQAETRKWPVLHAGTVPNVQLAKWDFQIWGRIETERRWTWEELRRLPQTDVFADMHCVTRWSQLNMTWHGVTIKELLKDVTILPDAHFVLAHCEQGFTTNLPLADLLDDDTLLAWGANGAELTPDHGWPLRLVVPKLYAWKSAKWIRGLEFLTKDQPGYWERLGYHMRGNPWTEERYGSW
jgi:DMSO/TMAO reductase YedYZ molybdopterin-dependent catalytic subunit